ncbi:MAG: hypothetical protein AB8B69_12570 [Chitinophagales bacterium]
MQTATKYIVSMALILMCLSCVEQTKPTTVNPKTAEKTASEEKTPMKVKSVEIQSFEMDEWTDGAKSGDGCSCSFRAEKDNYKTGDVFASNIEKEACIKLDGEVIALQGGRTDNSDELYKNSFESPWIILNEKGEHTLFGEKIDFDGK